MSSEQSFPRELLKQPPNVRLDYFRALIVGHPSLLRAYDDLQKAIRVSGPGSLILVRGPSGVGKTILLQKLEKDFTDHLLPELIKDSERLAVIRIEVIAQDFRNFNWNEYMWRLLVAM